MVTLVTAVMSTPSKFKLPNIIKVYFLFTLWSNAGVPGGGGGGGRDGALSLRSLGGQG